LKNSRIGGGCLLSTAQSQYSNNWVSTYLLDDPGLNWYIQKRPLPNEDNDIYIRDGDIIQLRNYYKYFKYFNIININNIRLFILKIL